MVAEPLTASDAVQSTIHDILNPYQVSSDVLGPSKILTYLQCPLSYKLRYVDRVRTPVMAPAALGSAIHSVIKHAHEWHWDQLRAGTAAEMLEAIWMGIEPQGADDPDVTLAYRQARDVWLPWYLWWQKPQETVMVEERWQRDVPGENVLLQGTIDRVYLEDGQFVVSDVKSGARAPGTQAVETHLQLSLYAWAFRECSGMSETPLEIVHLRGQRTYRTRRTDAYLERVLSDVVIPAARGIEAGIYPANPGSLYGCDYCVCQAFCPVGLGPAGIAAPMGQGAETVGN